MLCWATIVPIILFSFQSSKPFYFPPGWVILLESRPSIELAAPKSEEGLDTICFGWKCFYNELP